MALMLVECASPMLQQTLNSCRRRDLSSVRVAASAALSIDAYFP